MAWIKYNPNDEATYPNLKSTGSKYFVLIKSEFGYVVDFGFWDKTGRYLGFYNESVIDWDDYYDIGELIENVIAYQPIICPPVDPEEIKRLLS